MDTGEPRLDIHREGGIVRISFLDRNLLEDADIHLIGNQIAQLIDRETHPKVLISFEHVEHLSSAALGVLINVHSKLRDLGGQLRLSNIDPRLHEVFAITKLDTVFKIYEDAQQAVRSFQ